MTAMESILKVAIVLSIAIVANSQQDIPENFQCALNSPTSNNPVFSNTVPPVALTHIFCGEIKNGKAQGFHARSIVRNIQPKLQCARATGVTVNDDYAEHYMFQSTGIEVYNVATGEYIKKKTNQNKPDNFFPDAWTPQVIVDIVVKVIYKKCLKSPEPGKMPGQYCIKNYDNIPADDHYPLERISIMIFTDSNRIITAFPLKNNKYCKCDYQKVKHQHDEF